MAVERGWVTPRNDAFQEAAWLRYWVAMDECERKVAAGERDPGRPVPPHRSG